ncbi:precorrin-8X methylmutase [Salinarchaeum sp. IM2453]|uniref:precorrin-8X methylmutase n=1 Tax=Salinarchaeum sp. IM2453 TaxID=2862870 RepID=UPI001C8378BA|nr:precorrin-8X methylmutase [Salinarchaeum sp. IM2453]QZA88089.1 precorrin-8X methylmutase [Salinarchaeum sp. IM2453]
MTENDEYIDLGATTEQGEKIADTSMEYVRKLVPEETVTDRLRQKAVHATGDPEFAHLLRTQHDPAIAGGHAILDECMIVTDVTMPYHGITDRGHNCQKRSAINYDSSSIEQEEITRTAASIFAMDRDGLLENGIIVIGNAPTAAFALADCIKAGTQPAVIVATPVGFVKADESRKTVRDVAEKYNIPAVTNVGRRGGSGLAAALTNEFVHIATDIRNGEVSEE